MKDNPKNFIKFLGTGGARFVVSKQLRASGGMWLSLDGTNVSIDPGPGALVHCISSRPKLDPLTLDGIILSHRHLDHSGDINVMIEAMTNGGYTKKGIVFAPREALNSDPVIFKYVRSYPAKITVISAGKSYRVGNISFSTPIKHIHHGSEAYGVKIKGKNKVISYITDGKFFPGLIKAYRGSDVIIMNVLRPEESNLDHLSVEDAKKLIRGIKPRAAIMTHFGMQMLKAHPWEIAEAMTKELKVKVIAASDGMTFKL